MKIKNLLSTNIIIIILAILAGVAGAWGYLALVNQYQPKYSAQDVLNNPDAQVVIRDAKKVIVEQDNKVVETINSVEYALAGIFKQNNLGQYNLTESLGQALIITSDGWLLSNFNFANQPGSNFVVITSDKQIYQIDQVIKDQISGLVFVHVAQAKNLPVSRFAKANSLRAGQLVVGVNWYGPAWLSNISQVNQEVYRSSEASLKKLSLVSQPTSGLALADLSGQVVGILVNSEVKTANYFISAINDLLTNQPVSQAYLGVNFQNLYLTTGQGAKQGALLVANNNQPAVMPQSPASQAGLQANDIITAIDGVVLNGGDDLAEMLLDYQPGDKIVVSYLRDNKSATVEIVLANQPQL